MNEIVSIIITTRNSRKKLESCIRSCLKQSYRKTEVILIDNYSTDSTVEVAKKYLEKVYSHGPERTAQRNFGAKKSLGKYLLFLDSDMIIAPDAVRECVEKMKADRNLVSLVIPEQSIGSSFWARCKSLEKRFYLGIDWLEASRFFRKTAFNKVGGYNEKLVSGEDWDLQQKIGRVGPTGRISEYVFHDESNLSLRDTIKKKFYYAQKIKPYLADKNNRQAVNFQGNIIKRYQLFFSDPVKLFKNPFLGLGLLFMKSCEFGFGALGIMFGRLKGR